MKEELLKSIGAFGMAFLTANLTLAGITSTLYLQTHIWNNTILKIKDTK
jgi:hypothetical protein